mgnify:FL=1
MSGKGGGKPTNPTQKIKKPEDVFAGLNEEQIGRAAQFLQGMNSQPMGGMMPVQTGGGLMQMVDVPFKDFNFVIEPNEDVRKGILDFFAKMGGAS